jgi:glycosyltransferase involved in cell wall biosynthesis
VIYIWNAHWSTAGGGEVYSALLAKTISESISEVILIGNCHHSVLGTISERLEIDITGLKYRQVSSEREIDNFVRHDDLFINASYGSRYIPKTKHSIFICHFPVKSREEMFEGIRSFFEPVKLLSNNNNTIPFIAGDCLVVENACIENIYDQQLEITCVVGSVKLVNSDGREVLLAAGGASKVTNERLLSIESVDKKVFMVKIQTNTKLGRIIGERKDSQKTHFSHNYTEIWSNSQFTKDHVKKNWSAESFVVYPPVKRIHVPIINKNPNQIISVGRFMSRNSGHSKNQLEMIEAFKKLCARSNRNWSLFLVGGVQARDYDYYLEVLKRANESKLAIFVVPNCSFAILDELRGESAIYWHATGLNSKSNEPEKMEHFGIAIVEAMLAGCVPLVHDSAGPGEILENFPNLRYKSLDELVDKTIYLVEQESREFYLSRLIEHSEKFQQFENEVISRVRKLL